MKAYKNTIPGQRIGNVTVISSLPPVAGRSRSLFQCGDCPNTFEANNNKVLTGHVRSCGCRRKDGESRLKALIVGERFGFLTIRGPADPGRSKDGRRQARSVAVCDCGRECEVLNSALRAKNTRNCGCRLSERSITRGYAYIRAQNQHRNKRFGDIPPLSVEQWRYVVHLPCIYCGRENTNAITVTYLRRVGECR
jgi:hypothetical protein